MQACHGSLGTNTSCPLPLSPLPLCLVLLSFSPLCLTTTRRLLSSYYHDRILPPPPRTNPLWLVQPGSMRRRRRRRESSGRPPFRPLLLLPPDSSSLYITTYRGRKEGRPHHQSFSCRQHPPSGRSSKPAPDFDDDASSSYWRGWFVE